MKRRYDVMHAVILLLFLVIANFIGNAIIKGIMLLLFSMVLMYSTIDKLRINKNNKFADKIFYGILLFLDSVLVLGAVFVIITAVFAA
jgi:hypothetical protein